jgi:hypothetical protein
MAASCYPKKTRQPFSITLLRLCETHGGLPCDGRASARPTAKPSLPPSFTKDFFTKKRYRWSFPQTMPFSLSAKCEGQRTNAPRFYWFDSGVARAAASLLFESVDRVWKGTALENMIYHELRVHNLTQNKNRQISFYNLS